MKILNSRLVILSASTILGYASLGVCPSYAGFQQNIAVNPAVDYVAPSEPKNEKVEKVRTLEVFDDRYVPETIKKKYKLDDSWFDKNQSVQVIPPADDASNLPVPLVQSDAASDPSQKAEARQVFISSWRASKGERLRDVLKRWSERTNTDLMWASPESPILKNGFSFVGNYHEAVRSLLEKEGGDTLHSQYRSEGIDPVMMTPASTITTNTPTGTQAEQSADTNIIKKIFEPEAKQGTGIETRWFGLSGAPLVEVIKVWAEDAGVDVVWQSEKNFALKESISHVGQFEDAIYKALSQYNNESIRPIGEIYKDENSGQMTLVVKTEVN